jgi:O-antigen/teichoic acid export membrane protein
MHLKKFIGIDFTVSVVLLTKLWQVCSGLITLILIAYYLSPELQGYFYTFYSLIALQVFVEMGLTFVIIQIASHEMAKLHWLHDGTVSGNELSKSRLNSLVKFSFMWFGFAGLIMLALLVPTGIFFYNIAAPDVVINLWKPWVLLVLFASINLFMTAAIAILEGCGKVREIAILRLTQSFISAVTIWVVLSLNGNLYALAAGSLASLIANLVLIYFIYGNFFIDTIRHKKVGHGIDWRCEIWPFQWRIAVSWISGYLAFQLFVPLLLATHGPVVAGQMGMSLQIIIAMNAAAISWITTKAPTFGKLIALNEINKLNELFFASLRDSLYFLVFGCIFFSFLLLYMNYYEVKYLERILPYNLMLFLFIIAISNHITGAQAAYLRAYKKEPFMILSLASGLSIAFFSVLLIPKLSVVGAVAAYSIGAIIVGLFGGTIIFLRKKKEYMAMQSLLL